MMDTIKSYLVSLGFNVDSKSFNDVTRSLDSVDHQVNKFAGTSVTKFAAASVAVTSFVATAVAGVAKYLDTLGQADIQNEKMARQLWTTEQNAMSFNATLKAMGVTLEDLYLSPTLMSQFKQLRGEAPGLQAPAEYKEQMRTIQSISFEFKRMKLEATYALQWIGYYLIKYLDGPLKSVKIDLRDLNDTIVKTMPKWTKQVAQVMSWFVQLGSTMIRGTKDVGKAFYELGKLIPDNLKIIAAAAASIGLIIASGPFGILAASILAVILLLDDFYTYLDGGEAAFGPMWQKLIDFKDELDASGQLQELKANFTAVFDSAGDVLDALGEIVKTLMGVDDAGEGLRLLAVFLVGTLNVALKTTAGLLESIAEYLQLIDSIISGNTGAFLIKQGEEARQELINEGKSVENLGGIWKEASRFAGDFFNPKEMFTPEGAGAKRMQMLFGDLAKGFSRNNEPAPYMLPQVAPNVDNSKVSISQTNNIYGSDPQATAGAAQDNLSRWMKDSYLRGLQGVIR